MKMLFSLLLALLSASAAWAQTSGVTVEVVLDQDQYLPDEELVVGVRIVNRSGQTLHFGKDNDWVTFSIQGDSNLVVPKTGDLPATGEFELPSAKAGTREFNLTPYFNFRKPGRYRLAVAVRVDPWNQIIVSKQVVFTIMNGVPLANLPDLQIGVPPKAGQTNQAPEIRRYVLQKASYLKQLQLYFRLLDSNGRTLKVCQIDRMVSFSVPEAQIDRFSNLHVLHQTGAKAFNYCVFSPDGELLLRHTHEYTETRPSLRSDSEGKIYVRGGIRRLTARDYPQAATTPAKPLDQTAIDAPEKKAQ